MVMQRHSTPTPKPKLIWIVLMIAVLIGLFVWALV